MGFKLIVRRTAVAAVVTMGLCGVAASPAWAKPAASATGIDISYPQCGSTPPGGRAFAIVGVNGGLANDYNSCLASQFSYAQKLVGGTKQVVAQTYLNTADPGNGVADWPSPNQPGAWGPASTPNDGTCDYANGVSGAGANSPACAYVYGYDMVAGIAYAGGSVPGDLSAFSTATGGHLYAQPVWLDVETDNSWQTGSTGLAMNIAALQGMVDAVQSAAGAAGTTAQPIGIYSTSSQWNQITGTPSGSAAGNLAGTPTWIPGARTQKGATSNCAQTAFTGGHVSITQWVGSYDQDYSCTG